MSAELSAEKSARKLVHPAGGVNRDGAGSLGGCGCRAGEDPAAFAAAMAGSGPRLSGCGWQASLSLSQPSWSGKKLAPAKAGGPTIHEFARAGSDVLRQCSFLTHPMGGT